ncbi:multidrug effflux MFS transporter [Mucilaginibacter ginkgonis]|uniref:Multidrug effflux MFS transporter n=1 Tax=Mucilaginibacter ginkgonis TaxID=2682091 RepID=A0A6I4IN93_9SPHI|nr:multidrug effflux MFS transporter [Mucilaginibacter ginkgonis]QQL49486.1 multidrug effflux MFS transporter [Mucilaginibacter ginkgonis]
MTTSADIAEARRNKTLIIFILGLLATIDPFSIDFYLPAFKDIAQDLHATINQVSLSISSYFAGMAIGQIIYGPIVDRFGRRRPLYFGLGLYIVSSVLCMTAHNVEEIITYRFMQALTGSVAAVAALAMVRDFYPVKESASIFSTIMLIIGISPLAAPSLGGLVASVAGWQWVFAILIFVVLVLIALVIFFLPPSALPDKTVSLKPKPIITTFWKIFCNRQFITFTLAGNFAFAILFVYVTASPIIFMDHYKLSPKAFGLIFTLLSFGFIASNRMNIVFLKRFSSGQIFKTAMLVQVGIAVIFLIAEWNDWLGMYGAIGMFLLMLGTLGSLASNSSAIALAPFKSNIGSASALLGFIQIGIAGAISALTGLVSFKTLVPIPALMLSTCIIAVLIYFIGTSGIKHLEAPDDGAVVTH